MAREHLQGVAGVAPEILDQAGDRRGIHES
jgi:hypothetical protein